MTMPATGTGSLERDHPRAEAQHEDGQRTGGDREAHPADLSRRDVQPTGGGRGGDEVHDEHHHQGPPQRPEGRGDHQGDDRQLGDRPSGSRRVVATDAQPAGVRRGDGEHDERQQDDGEPPVRGGSDRGGDLHRTRVPDVGVLS
jgi:hypothetical protein